jgi:hypothetical protein
LSKKRKLREGASRCGAALARPAPARHADQRPQLGRRGRRAAAVALEEVGDALQRLGRDARAVAQARDELAVVDGAAAEGRLGDAVVAAETPRCCRAGCRLLRDRFHVTLSPAHSTVGMVGTQPQALDEKWDTAHY